MSKPVISPQCNFKCCKTYIRTVWDVKSLSGFRKAI